MNKYFGYTRVSTVKQGEHGVSLQEQRAAIETYATRNSLAITQWFEERETAAKRGRPVFDRMIDLLNKRKASGVVIHKIDRSARNLRDWSDLGEMMDGGIEVHFANEALDLNSRGGRLSADIQAVVAADFIRNLREETKKGMRGRYKQGLFPLPAPIGYLDRGSGQPKAIDPIQGPLVRRMFELYASGRYGHHELADVMYDLGLRTKQGNRVNKSTFAWILANPFYYGVIRLKATGELFEGRHQPLISQTLFRAAREVATQRLGKRAIKHDFAYRRSLRCGVCGYNLTGERVKGIVYYRCRTQSCPPNAIRGDHLEAAIVKELSALEMSEDEKRYMYGLVGEISSLSQQQRVDVIHALQATLDSVKLRMSRVSDAYLDGVLDKDVIIAKQKTLLEERKGIEDQLDTIKKRNDVMSESLKEFLDFAANVKTVFAVAAPEIKQRLLRRVALRVTLTNRITNIVLQEPYHLFASRPKVRSMTCNGVHGPERVTSNRQPSEYVAMNIEQKTVEGTFSPNEVCTGCPSRVVLRTRLSTILKDISSLLLTESTYSE
ncbi:MAG: recombinase family protein [Terracidiphilus sp.]